MAEKRINLLTKSPEILRWRVIVRTFCHTVITRMLLWMLVTCFVNYISIRRGDGRRFLEKFADGKEKKRKSDAYMIKNITASPSFLYGHCTDACPVWLSMCCVSFGCCRSQVDEEKGTLEDCRVDRAETSTNEYGKLDKSVSDGCCVVTKGNVMFRPFLHLDEMVEAVFTGFLCGCKRPQNIIAEPEVIE